MINNLPKTPMPNHSNTQQFLNNADTNELSEGCESFVGGDILTPSNDKSRIFNKTEKTRFPEIIDDKSTSTS